MQLVTIAAVAMSAEAGMGINCTEAAAHPTSHGCRAGSAGSRRRVLRQRWETAAALGGSGTSWAPPHLVAPLAPAPGAQHELGVLEQCDVLLVLEALALRYVHLVLLAPLLTESGQRFDRRHPAQSDAGCAQGDERAPPEGRRNAAAESQASEQRCKRHTLHPRPHPSSSPPAAPPRRRLNYLWAVTPLTASLASYCSLPMKVTSYCLSCSAGMGQRLWSLLQYSAVQWRLAGRGRRGVRESVHFVRGSPAAAAHASIVRSAR